MPPLTPLWPARSDEFPKQAALWPPDLDRREFLGLMGASVALAGLSGCGRSFKQLVPYVVQPESIVPGLPLFYASAMAVDGYARGILVETHEGRPTKIEGNPNHPESLGATDAATQASILSLYDPDRSRAPLRAGQPAAWSEFESEWGGEGGRIRGDGGGRFALLTEPTTSPTLRREIHRLLDRFPRARWFQHTALARYDEGGGQPDYDLAGAEIILSIEGDFLDLHPAALRYARAFAGRRRIENGAVRANRLYALESAWSLAGAMADHRLPVAPARQRQILNAIARAWEGGSPSSSLTPEEKRFVSALIADWRAHAPRVLCLAGAEQAPEVRQWASAMNQALGAKGLTVNSHPPVRSDPDPRSAGNLGELADAISRGEVSALAVLGCNPVYTGPAELEFARCLHGLAFTVHCGGHADETAAHCLWHLPESHYLETWSDLRGYEGSAVIQQPMIEPLHDSRSLSEVIHLLAGGPAASAYDLVRETWRETEGGDNFDERWNRWLNRGVVEEAGAGPLGPKDKFGRDRRGGGRVGGMAPGHPPALRDRTGPPGLDATALQNSGLTLLFRPDPTLGDGRWANNGWLQELPRPFTNLVWDNALLIPPGLAAERKLANGDIVLLQCGEASVEAPVWIVAGQAEGCVIAHLGGGRSRAGRVGDNRGFNANLVRGRWTAWERSGARISPTGRRASLASTQHHFAMEGRDPARCISLAELDRIAPEKEASSLYAKWPRDRYAWGMSIDLSTCIGCSACVIACQAENNIPVVGKEQVLRGREMHWIRIDRYTLGNPGNPRALVQPVPCMHCENAPCELVCPVGATDHSSEGLNEMVYNRCVGTRYCSNNCPYKVRRFNFFDFRAAADSILHLQDNPNVTVRERGVMEKCTYCVQRINSARILAEREGRPIRDGEIRTACQQACPVEAIVFGNIAEPASAVARRKSERANYALLGELNTRPRTTYLPKIVNPAPGFGASEGGDTAV